MISMVEWRTRLSGWVPGYPDERIERGIMALEDLVHKYEARHYARNKKTYGEDKWSCESVLKRVRYLSTYIDKAEEKHSARYNEMLDVLRCYGADIDDIKMAVEWELHASEDKGVPKGVVRYRYKPIEKKPVKPIEVKPTEPEKKPAEPVPRATPEPVDTSVKEPVKPDAKPADEGNIEAWYKKAYGYSYSDVIGRYCAFVEGKDPDTGKLIKKGGYGVEDAFRMAINKTELDYTTARILEKARQVAKPHFDKVDEMLRKD
jgi:hypothetical protein